MSTEVQPAFTEHARLRFAERFPELVLAEEWATAKHGRGLGKKLFKFVRKGCPTAGPRYMSSREFKGIYYKVSKNKVIFVVRPPMEIITVLQVPMLLPNAPQWPLVPGIETPAVRYGNLRSDRFEQILKAGNAMHKQLAALGPGSEELLKQWEAAINPVLAL